MVINIILQFSRLIRIAGNILIKLSQRLEGFKRSKIIIKGGERSLYKTRFNDLFWLNINNSIDQCIICDGIFEPCSTQIIKQLIKEGDIVLDVGANIGYYSILFSRLVGTYGKVLCFEPTECYWKILKMNLEANRANNVEVFKIGLSNKSQELVIQIGGSTATLHSPGNRALETKEFINLISLDKFMEESKLPKIDFIKVDIDGHEPLFFEGAWKTLERYNPTILLEVSHLHYLEAGFTAWDFYDTLKRKNYKIYHEDKLVELKTKEDFLVKCGNFAYSANIVITRKELKA